MPVLPADSELDLLDKTRAPKPGGPRGGGPVDWQPGGGRGGDDDDYAGGSSRGFSASMVGMIATMVSILALFTTIIIAYAVRSRNVSHWGHVIVPWSLWLSTGLIVASSFTFAAAKRAFDRKQHEGYGRWLVFTLFLGFGFLVSQAFSVRELAARGFYLRGNPHSSLYYVITGTHAIHLIGGILGLLYLIYRFSIPGPEPSYRRQANAISVTGVYWHFLDILWVALFITLLLWK